MKNSEKHPSVSKVKYYIKFGVVGAGITLIWLMFLVPVIIYHLPQEVLKELYFNTQCKFCNFQALPTDDLMFDIPANYMI